jgi:outer membrane protein assembly factor BamB
MIPVKKTNSLNIVWMACAALLVLLSFTALQAVSSRTWRQRELADFKTGEPRGVSLSADGAIRLSPPLEILYETPQPYVWALANDASGTIYAAGGNQGTIYRITASGEAEVFFTAAEPEVSALAVGLDGALYVGAVPGGRIYRVPPDGGEALASETKQKYIWSLAVDQEGHLYAGTGLKGRIYKFDKQGQGRVLFDSAETHIRVLRLDDKGNLIAGTDGHGLIFRVSPQGEAFVLYDASLDEVASLVIGTDGTIYAAVMDQRGRPPQRKAPPPAEKPKRTKREGAAPRQPGQSDSTSGKESQQAPKEQRVPISLAGKVLAISPDGYAREVWAGNEEAILSLALASDGHVLMGSSVQGRIYALDPNDGSVSEVTRAAAGQITVLLTVDRSDQGNSDGGLTRGGDVIVGGSNLGMVALLQPGYAASGVFESRVLDARSFATWGRLAWRGDRPRHTEIAVSARSGNTEEPDQTWSDWGPALTDPSGSVVGNPSARFLQWSAELKTSDQNRTPVLREVSVTYLQRNLPPEIRKVEIQAPGISFQKVPATGPRPSSEAGSGGSTRGDVQGAVRKNADSKKRKGFDPGARSVIWQAIDPNNDELLYDVYFRALDEKTWKPVRTRIEEAFVTLDSTAMPDGTYQFRVVATDAASNPQGQALTAESTSSPFDVDNTPPTIEDVKVSVRSSEVRVTFSAQDTFSLIREAAYSIDAAEWLPTGPVDGLHDALQESYDLILQIPVDGEHTFVVRATDAAGNTGAARVVFEVP